MGAYFEERRAQIPEVFEIMKENLAEQEDKKLQSTRAGSLSPELFPDKDPEETQEWMESLDEVLVREGPERTQFLLRRLLSRAHHHGISLQFAASTPYINTIPKELQPDYPGNRTLE